VLIADLTSDEDRPLDLARELEDVVRAAWKGGTELAWAPDRPGEEGGFEIRAAYVTLLLNDGEPLAGAGEGEAYVAVHATATREAGGVKVEVYEEEERITAPFRGEKDALRQVLLAELAEVTGKVRARLAARIKAHHATDAELVRALTSGRPVERSQAAVEAGERRLEAAIPALIEALEADDAMLVIRAAGALGSLGDDRATRPLAGLTASNDDDVLSAAVYALGDIGTPLARRYLQEMAESHAYATVRDKASEVLGKN
jgi:hypothetical protein